MAVKVQEKERKEWDWMKEAQKAQQDEWSSVAVSDKVGVEKVLERVANEIWETFCQVSLKFLGPLSQS